MELAVTQMLVKNMQLEQHITAIVVNVQLLWCGYVDNNGTGAKLNRLLCAVFLFSLESAVVRWTVREKERKKIDAFELWTWGRILRVPWTEKRTNLFSFRRRETQKIT